ncbi:sulfite exporter TauE/SafE family protein [Leptospira ryugenii]|uniref:sulfite exporter TauE/SafE family protein n=1 Tax=Leptospira ryugenii TaxID=1917863 RepID=UPI000D59DFC6|nr:sulfite exporter TauE/SafE family protein [Leptospira ryugenii]
MNPESLGLLGSAFLFGLTSSVHCVAMCGPIVSLLQKSAPKNQVFFLHQSGRLFSYLLMGIFLASLGKGANSFGSLVEIQNIAGILSILMIIMLGFQYLVRGKSINAFSRIYAFLQNRLRNDKHSIHWDRFLLGSLSAFLPCGILYPAYAMSFATGEISMGLMVMLSFFIGTVPALFGFSLGFRTFASVLGPRYVRYLGVVMVVVALGFSSYRLMHPTHSESCAHPHSD